MRGDAPSDCHRRSARLRPTGSLTEFPACPRSTESLAQRAIPDHRKPRWS